MVRSLVAAIAAGSAAAILTTPCLADTPDSKGQEATTVNDQNNYAGDRIKFGQDILVEVEGPDHKGVGEICLARRWELRGGNNYTANTTGAAGASGTPESGTRFTLLHEPKQPLSKSLLAANPLPAACDPQLLAKATKPANYDPTLQSLLKPGTVVRITSTQLTETPPDRVGLTYGALTVPLKFHLTGQKAITGSASIGPYVGYRTDNEGYGYGVSWIAFVAASNISVPITTSTTAANGTETTSQSTQNLFGVSYGLGAVAQLKHAFQLGIVVGADRVNSSAHYEYNGKPWLAVELGYAFLQ